MAFATFEKVMGYGNVTQEPIVRYTHNGRAVLNLNYCYDKVTGRDEKTGKYLTEPKYRRYVVWDQPAFEVEARAYKGAAILIVDAMINERPPYQDKGGTWHSDFELTGGRVIVTNPRDVEYVTSEEFAATAGD